MADIHASASANSSDPECCHLLHRAMIAHDREVHALCSQLGALQAMLPRNSAMIGKKMQDRQFEQALASAPSIAPSRKKREIQDHVQNSSNGKQWWEDCPAPEAIHDVLHSTSELDGGTGHAELDTVEVSASKTFQESHKRWKGEPCVKHAEDIVAEMRTLRAFRFEAIHATPLPASSEEAEWKPGDYAGNRTSDVFDSKASVGSDIWGSKVNRLVQDAFVKSKLRSATGSTLFEPRTTKKWVRSAAEHTTSKTKGSFSITDFVRGPSFDSLSLVVSALHTVMLGIEVNQLKNSVNTPVGFMVVNYILFVWYIIELNLRVWLDPANRSNPWNVFDGVVILITAFEIIAVWIAGNRRSILRILRIIRVARILRVVRVGRWLQHLQTFAKIAHCLMNSMAPLLSAMSMLAVVIYVFAIIITSASLDHQLDVLENGKDPVDALYQYFGSVETTFFTLAASVSGGIDWNDAYAHLFHLSWYVRMVFLAYISFTTLCVMNIVMGIFVDSSLAATEHFKELQIIGASTRKRVLVDYLSTTFNEIDTDQDGFISTADLVLFLEKDAGQALFDVLGLGSAAAEKLMQLLDGGKSGSIDMSEFCEGCMKIHGGAKSFDVHYMLYEHAKVFGRWEVFMAFTESHLNEMRLMLEAFAENLSTRESGVRMTDRLASVSNQDGLPARSEFRQSVPFTLNACL